MDTGKTSILLSQPPHVGTPEQPRGICCDLLLALAPAALLGIVNYGLRALLAMALCTACGAGVCMLLGILSRRGVRLDECLYTVYICLLCAFGFGAGCALWVFALAGVLCALLIPALGPPASRGIFHPAAAAFLLCTLVFSPQTGAYIAPLDGFDGFFSLSLKNISIYEAPAALLAQGETLSPAVLAIGGTASALGASSALALAVGGIYLILRRIGSLRVPVTACAVLFVLALLFPDGQARFSYAAAQLLCGGFLTGAFFFLLPVSGAPVSRRGQLLYAAGYGALCFAVRRLSGADGVLPALVFMQAFAWSLDFSRVLARIRIASVGARMEALLLRGTKGRRETPREAVSPQPAPAASPEDLPEAALPQEEAALEDIENISDADGAAAQDEPLSQEFPLEQETPIPCAAQPADTETDGEQDGNERI